MYTPPIFLCLVLWWTSSQPQAPMPAHWHDKVVHALAFGFLSGLWTRAFWFTTTWKLGQVMAAAALLAGVYGLIDEVHQSFVQGRDASTLDAVADGLGALAGALIVGGAYELFRRLKSRSS